jgi:hypothetical protein
LAFYFGFGLPGLWIGALMGEVLLGTSTSYYIWWHSDWNAIVRQVSERNEAEMMRLKLVAKEEGFTVMNPS